MFEVGEKVASVLDDWPGVPFASTKFPLCRNQIFTVLKSYPANGPICTGLVAKVDLISIGVENTDFEAWCIDTWSPSTTIDLWPANWFRRLQRLDTSEGMQTLVGLFQKQSTPEVISA
jgi:hypothetical protein